MVPRKLFGSLQVGVSIVAREVSSVLYVRGVVKHRVLLPVLNRLDARISSIAVGHHVNSACESLSRAHRKRDDRAGITGNSCFV